MAAPIEGYLARSMPKAFAALMGQAFPVGRLLKGSCDQARGAQGRDLIAVVSLAGDKVLAVGPIEAVDDRLDALRAEDGQGDRSWPAAQRKVASSPRPSM